MKIARDIMTGKVITLDPELPLDEMESSLRSAGISGAPVADGGVLVGIVSRSDVARLLSVQGAYLEHAMEASGHVEGGGSELVSIAEQLGKRLQSMKVRDAMIREVDTVLVDSSVQAVAQKMLGSRHRRLVVLESNGKIAGIVTATDLVRVVADQD